MLIFDNISHIYFREYYILKKQIKIHEIWKVSAVIHGIKLPDEIKTSVSFNNWILSNTDSSNGVRISGKISVPYGISIGISESYKQFWIFIGCIMANIPELALSEPWTISEFDMSLDNDYELIRNKLDLPSKISIEVKSSLLMSFNNLKLITEEYQKLLDLSTNNNDALILTKMLKYFAKAQTQQNPEDRFIWNWFALNLAYNHNATSVREIGKINEFGKPIEKIRLYPQ